MARLAGSVSLWRGWDDIKAYVGAFYLKMNWWLDGFWQKWGTMGQKRPSNKNVVTGSCMVTGFCTWLFSNKTLTKIWPR